MRQAEARLAFLGEFVKPDEEMVVLGVVEKARGLRGEVVFHPLSQQPEVFASYHTVRIGDNQGRFSRPAVVASSRVLKDAVAFRLAGVEKRDQAEQLLGCAVALAARDLPELADDEYYWRELVGLDVYDASMEHIGRVAALFNNGAHDVLVVVDKDGEEILLPMVKELIRRTVLESRRVLLVESVSGLLEANRATA